MDFGYALKKIRKQKQYTLTNLAAEIDLSVSYLSNLENNVTSPTLTNLQSICEALGVSMVEMLEDSNSQKAHVVREDERKQLFATDSGVNYHLVNGKLPQAQVISMTIDKDNFNEEVSWGHHYDEIGIVVKGALEITVSEETYQLFEGDAIYIKSHKSHKYKKIGSGECKSYWIYPPSQ
ncbi:XRE family transcriptional regulator [Staphylococcus kloosii]|jgi:quercetin dioxygenase-like cupin family protein|uniref:XRE family transcriptional regulator n=1 Tax=Staphylococcus kloosii TaxID=29384 RepID=UPI00189ED01E|nr:XRE family transcriptional regulator [Staphylococcus kloosii]MBF7025530.1 helix-turn-helix transcriptional regulator [Staphylococcus kloosii]